MQFGLIEMATDNLHWDLAAESGIHRFSGFILHLSGCWPEMGMLEEMEFLFVVIL